MVLAWPALIVCIAGIPVWFVSKDAKASELGRLMFWTGLFIVLWHLGLYWKT